jgi:hypothetical protein
MIKGTESKLFTILRELNLPDSVQQFRDSKKINYQHIPSTAFVCWPNGKPCVPVNMYLLDNVHKWTGNTAITYASELSELIRYCDTHCKSFSELADSDIFILVDKLRTDVYLNDPHQRVRNDNTVRKIIQRSLDFLDWYQGALYHGSAPLIGERSEAPAIICERKKSPHSSNYFWEHRYARLGNSTEPKLPIGLSVIDDIEATIEKLGEIDAYPKPAMRRFKHDPALFEALLDYLYERRTFMVWVMKRTGLRPEEMAKMSLRENLEAGKDCVLILPTMKRRKLEPPLRKFPISVKDGRAVLRYVSARKKWGQACSERDTAYHEPDSMFLGTEPGNFGAAIGNSGLSKDFKKLCNLAGYRDQQACFSMFRHRFITYEVLSHLRQWEERKGPVSTDQDYRTILERVRVKTGHGSVASLWNYIDLAREMDGVWANIDKAVGRLHAGEHLKMDLEHLRRDLRHGIGKHLAAEQVINLVCLRLEGIIRDAHDPLT